MSDSYAPERAIIHLLTGVRSFTSAFSKTDIRIEIENPSAETLRVFSDATAGQNMIHASNIDELMTSLNE